MRLYSWNVNGVRAICERGQLDFLWEDADIVCLQETKVSPGEFPGRLISLPGFTSTWAVCTERKGYSGVATFVRDDYKPEAATDRGMGVDRFDDEGRCVRTDHGWFVLYNLYFPNSGKGPARLQYKREFNARFLEVIDADRAAGREVIICGDVNAAHREIDIHDPAGLVGSPGVHPDERGFVDALLERGFIDTFRAEHGDLPEQYTWWDMRTNKRPANKGWRIDYFFVSEGLEDDMEDAFISPQVFGSDHCPVGLTLAEG